MTGIWKQWTSMLPKWEGRRCDEISTAGYTDFFFNFITFDAGPHVSIKILRLARIKWLLFRIRIFQCILFSEKSPHFHFDRAAFSVTVTSHGPHGVSNNRQLDYFYSKENIKAPHYWTLILRVAGGPSRKGPVLPKAFSLIKTTTGATSDDKFVILATVDYFNKI